MSQEHTHDVVGIGLGPFNLGLACLSEPIDELDAVFLEARDRFSWHPGLLLEDAILQVPFLADLVTMADPTSRFSFLSFLKDNGRLYPFYIRESFYPLRREYDQYCRWAAEQLASVRFGERVTRVEHDGSAYVVRSASGETFRGRHLVLGTGTTPYVPEALRPLLDEESVLHSGDYLSHREQLQELGSITVVGSGQSAAEVYADLLDGILEHGYELTWLTRSPRFYPLEYTKLTLEMTSPEYTSYFHHLPGEVRDELLASQQPLYKGISEDTVNDIFDKLYSLRTSADVPTTLLTCTSLEGARRHQDEWLLDLHHVELHRDFGLRTQGLVLATGYREQVPDFLDPVRDRVRWDARGRYDVDERYGIDEAGTILVQNAESHTHGLVAPDLGMGAFRNSVILARVLGWEPYPVEKRIAVQDFGVPDRLRAGAHR